MPEPVLHADPASPDYWNGWLANAVASAVTNLRRVDLHSRDHFRAYTADDVAASLERSLDAFLQHGPADSVKQALNDGILWGWALLDANGELYALRESWPDARAAKGDAENFLDGAATCGHPRAEAWVNERVPFVLRQVTRGERAALLDEWGTPVLDREP